MQPTTKVRKFKDAKDFDAKRHDATRQEIRAARRIRSRERRALLRLAV
jgi:hypothetical protein